MLYYDLGLLMPRSLQVSATNRLENGYSFGCDFYPVWLTSREWLREGRYPYSDEMTRDIQQGVFGRPLDPNIPTDPRDLRMFAHPAFVVLLFWPAAELPFAVSRVVVAVLLAAMTAASVLAWIRAMSWRIGRNWMAVILLLTMCSYPAIEALYVGQVGLLVAFLLAASLLGLQRGRFLLAGVLMAITTMKPQLTLLVIFYLVVWSVYDWRTRGRFCLGLFSTLGVMVGASLAVMPHWIQSWTHAILAYRHYTQPPLVTEVLASPLGPRWADPTTLTLTGAAITIAILLAWRNRAAAFGSFAFWITLSLLLAITTIFILPGQAIYDHLILLPGILLLVRYRNQLRGAGRVPRTLLAIGGLVLFWPWIAAFALILSLPLLAPAVFNSTSVLALPLRSAASLPFAVLALLAWTWRIETKRVNFTKSQESAEASSFS
jgi:Glycosyltransferase family 87